MDFPLFLLDSTDGSKVCHILNCFILSLIRFIITFLFFLEFLIAFLFLIDQRIMCFLILKIIQHLSFILYCMEPMFFSCQEGTLLDSYSCSSLDWLRHSDNHGTALLGQKHCSQKNKPKKNQKEKKTKHCSQDTMSSTFLVFHSNLTGINPHVTTLCQSLF